MFYLITVAVAFLAIVLANFFTSGDLTPINLGLLSAKTLCGIAAVFIIDGLAAFIARRLPEKYFAPDAKLFTVGKREQQLYRRTKINKWKRIIPEWGCFTGFHKDRMLDPNSSEYVGRFLLESNYGVLGHVAGAILGFLIMLIPFTPPLTVSLPIAAVNLVLSILPTMILRYNTPPLRRIYRRNLEREGKKNK